MIHAVLWLLKIIGIIMLILLGLLVLAVLLVLFAAVCYQAEGSFLEKRLKGTAKISWLFHIVSAHIVWDDEIQAVVRVFGIPVWKRKESETETASDLEETLADEMEDMMVSIQEAEPLEEKYSDPPLSENDCKAETSRVKPELNREPPKRNVTEKAARKSVEEPAEGSEKSFVLETIFQKAKQTVERLQSRFKRIAAQKDKIVSWIEDEANQKSVKLVFRQIGKLFRHLIPKKGHGKITFGFGDDPYLTGQILAGIAPFYALYGEQIEVCPDFERSVFDIEGSVKGRIRIGFLIGYVVRLLIDKNIRKNIRAFMRR